MSDTTPTERGGERIILRYDGRSKLPYTIVREVDDSDFPGRPFWVEAERLGNFRTKDDARLFMVARTQSAADAQPKGA